MQNQVQPFIYTRNVGGHQKSFIIQTDKVTLTFQGACQKKPPTQGWRIINLHDIPSFSKALVCSDQIRICEQGQKFTLQLTCGITKKYALQSFKSKQALNPEGISNLMRKQLQEDADYGVSKQISKSVEANQITPAQGYVRLAIQMILESLRLQEMAKHSPQDATKALNNANKIFGGMVQSSIPPKCLMITSSSSDLQASIKKDQQQFRKHFPSANIIQTTKNPYTEVQIYNIIENHYAQDSYSSERVYKIFYTGHGHFKGDLAAENKNKQTLRIELEPILSKWIINPHMEKGCKLHIYLDSCFSGRWIERLQKYRQNNPKLKNFALYCSSLRDQTSIAHRSLGGMYLYIYFNDEISEQDEKKMIVRYQMKNQHPCSYHTK